MTTKRLSSTSIFDAARMIQGAEEVGKTDEPLARKIIGFWSNDEQVINKILTGDYTVDGKGVLVEVEDEQAS